MPDFIPQIDLSQAGQMAQRTMEMRANRANPWDALLKSLVPAAQAWGQGKMENRNALARETASMKLHSLPADQLEAMIQRIRAGGGSGAPGGGAPAGAAPAATGWGRGVDPVVPQTWSSHPEWE